MSQYELNSTGLNQLHLAIKDIYALVISVNYTKDTYSVIDSSFDRVVPCSDKADFLAFATALLKNCCPEDIQNYPLIYDFDSLVEHLRNNKGSYNFEVRFETMPFMFNWYEGTCFFEENPETGEVFLLLLFKDINNDKLIEENLRDAFKATELAAMAKTDFLSRMSQDLRTPISLIVSMIDLARQNIDDKDKVMDCLVKMDISSRYLFQIIDNILDMSKIEAGKFSINNCPFDLLEVLTEIREAYSEQALSKNITFEIREHVKGLTNLVGDSLRLKQALKSIVSNAFKYAPADGSIVIEVFLNRVTYNRAFFAFTIQNDGPPLDESELSRLFRPFETGTMPIHAKGSTGAGLGLSICKNTVELLGGSIKGYNALSNDGVIFEIEVSFELDEDNAPDDIEILADYAYIRFPQKTVLVAEDDNQTFETIKALLENRDITVDLAINGLEAVQAFDDSPPGYYDLILMEMDLPLMSGLDAITAIRNSFHENGATIPIVGMSLDILEQNATKMLNAGMNSHIMKPIDSNRLFETLKNYF